MLGCFADILLWPLKMLWPHWAEAIGHIGAYDYRFYFGVYVQNVGRFTQVYMALIDPLRKLIVYPSLLRSIRASWNQAFGAASHRNTFS